MRKLLIFVTAFIFIFGMASIVRAALPNPWCPDPADSDCIDSFPDLIAAIGDFLFTLGLIVVPLILVAAGLLFITSGGNPQRTDQAKRMLTWAVIGFAVMMAAKVLASIIKTVIEGF